jgi:arginine/lysine/ornithine decarboxylase
MDLGADLCCDSAHKTLPVLTGGAYLHTSRVFSPWQVKNALGLFGSTSPSYLILQSLDLANGYLEDHDHRLAEFLPLVHKLKETLWAYGYRLTGQEPMKITIAAKEFGYTGNQLGDFLRQAGIECEFSDPDYLVLMVSPETTRNGLEILKNTLCRIAKKPAITDAPPAFCPGTPCQSIRDAMLSPGAVVSIEESEGRILGAASVGCPPAVPIVVCGEKIDQHAIECFRYYGISTVTVTVP